MMTHHAAAIALNPNTIYLIWGIADRLLRVMLGVFVLHSAFEVARVQWFGPRLEAQTRAATRIGPISQPHVGARTETPR